jgi:hypothetical protein
VPSELPEEECNNRTLMLVATNAAADDGFDLSVPDFVGLNDCCLHGSWVVNNEDMAELWTAGIGYPVTVSGTLSANFGTDGHVQILWSGYTRAYSEGDCVPDTDVIDGGGSQAYSTRSGNLLTYGGPELTPTLDPLPDSCGQDPDPFPVALDTWYGDVLTTQFYECEGDTLITVVEGPGRAFDIEWSRVN